MNPYGFGSLIGPLPLYPSGPDHFGLTLVTPPATEPLTLSEAKSHGIIQTAADDAFVTSLIQAARECCERVTERALITQTWKLVLDRFPRNIYGSDAPMRLPRPPLASVTSITYVDTDGTTQTWASSNYLVDTDSEPGRVAPAVNAAWPVSRAQQGAVTVTYVAGYGAASAVPEEIKQRLRNYVAYCYEHRGENLDQDYLDSLFGCFGTGEMR